MHIGKKAEPLLNKFGFVNNLVTLTNIIIGYKITNNEYMSINIILRRKVPMGYP
jgi:hypothetical protein